MIRFLTAGESHGPAEIGIIEGVPAGLAIDLSDIQNELEKRRFGPGRSGRGYIEKDKVKILSGIRLGKTIGAPIALLVENEDHQNWKNKAIPDVTNPRPGHADLAGVLKYRFTDIRNVLERASARETIMRVALGAICKKFLREFEIKIISHTIQIGNITSHIHPNHKNWINLSKKSDPNTRCLDPLISKKMNEAILEAIRKKDTLGGVIEIVVFNTPVGLGSYAHYDRRLDGIIAQTLMSIQSVKAVEIGDGFKNVSSYGSEVHDEIFYKNKSFFRKSNRAGGIEGGVTNGEDIIVRIYLKPISTIGNPLQSVNISSKKPEKAVIERSDICVVPRAGVIGEGALALVLANIFVEKFGGDSIDELKTNFHNYKKYLSEF